MLTSNIIRSIQEKYDPRRERCGVVLGNNEILEITNISSNPANSFIFNKREWLTLLNQKADIKVIWHTHPVNCQPSLADEVNQKKFKQYPFLIVTKDDYLWLT